MATTWWCTQQYFDDLPNISKRVRRWLRRRVHLEVAVLVGDRWEDGDHDELVECAVARAMEDPQKLIFWNNYEEYQGSGYASGAWKLREPKVITGVASQALARARTELDGELSLDSWLLNFDNGLLYDEAGPVEKSGQEVWPAGADDWQRRRLEREWRCQKRGCKNVIDSSLRGARVRKFCETCRPRRQAPKRPRSPKTT